MRIPEKFTDDEVLEALQQYQERKDIMTLEQWFDQALGRMRHPKNAKGEPRRLITADQRLIEELLQIAIHLGRSAEIPELEAMKAAVLLAKRAKNSKV